LYMNAYCYYLNSPHYKLDQTYTENALAELQNFIDQYPESHKLDTCNLLMDKLHENNAKSLKLLNNTCSLQIGKRL